MGDLVQHRKVIKYKMIRILQIIGSLEQAGAENFLMNLYRSIDRTKVQFDFAIYNTPSENSFYEEVLQMGAKVFFLPSKSENFIKNMRTIREIVMENNYQYVWRHTDGCFGGVDLLAAKWGRASKLILHSHSTNNKGIEHVLHLIFKPIVNKHVTHRFACGELAGKWMFGKKKFVIIRNGINADKFEFDERVRTKYRKEYRLIDKVVVGHIGRFHEVKNHKFIIELFRDFLQEVPNAMLVLIGDGILKEQIEGLTVQYNLKEKVLFLNTRTDIAQLLAMMDIFLLPSLYEGFPVTLIEAQATGVPCVVSSIISKETNICGKVHYLDLDKPTIEWIRIMKREVGQRYLQEAKLVRKLGYDIAEISKSVMDKVLI